MHLQDALQEFLLQLEADGRSPHTIGQYRRHVTALGRWMAGEQVPLDTGSLAPCLIARFFASDAAKGAATGAAKKPTSLNAMRTSVRCFCRHLHDAGVVPANPARLLKRARCATPPPRGIRPGEIERLEQILQGAPGAASLRDRMLIRLLAATGCRLSAALGIDVEDIDFDHGEITLRTAKNACPTTLLLPAATLEQLRGFLGDRRTGSVFRTQRGRLDRRQAQRRIATWLERAGIRGRSAHSFRHGFATRLLERTGNLRLVQAALHHRSIVSTTVYAQIGADRLRAAIGI